MVQKLCKIYKKTVWYVKGVLNFSYLKMSLFITIFLKSESIRFLQKNQFFHIFPCFWPIRFINADVQNGFKLQLTNFNDSFGSKELPKKFFVDSGFLKILKTKKRIGSKNEENIFFSIRCFKIQFDFSFFGWLNGPKLYIIY